MSLEVLIRRATNLANLEKIGKSDPYVILLFQGIKKKTNYITGNLNPEWNETLTWTTGKQQPSTDDSLSIWVKDYERVGRNRLMGETTLLLRNAWESTEPVEYELTLYDHNQRPTTATLFLTVTCHRPEKTTEESSQIHTGFGDPVVAGEKKISANGVHPQHLDVLRGDSLDISLSKTKIKYQLRVYVVEARNLIGSKLNPVCQVTVSHLAKQTQVAKATSNPWWKEMFFFNVECTTLDLFSEILQFKVLNARALRSNMLIGSFEIDLGQVYAQPQHAYINKWLMLKNDDEEALSEVMGYLKASIAVIGPGSGIPDFTTSEGDKDDVESNLLLPTGTQLKPATFMFDLYQAADLPRMDAGAIEGIKRIFTSDEKKELIDPYMEISFAGNKVTSKIIYGEDSPSWNEKLYIGFKFPSVCKNIQLTLKDWDRVSEDDTIAMALIDLPVISAPGANGFLPCFGPTWVNFYGAPREFSLLSLKTNDNTSSDYERCSFRGRALLSLKTDLGSYPNVKSLPIDNDDILRVQSYCRVRRFRLHATFLDATMVNVIDAPVEFEVSIGNFGNKFENRFVPSPSSTQPTNAIFDGCRYYYLPWRETKPSVVVISEWEDVTFRLEALNLLNRLTDDLENFLQEFDCTSGYIQQTTECDPVANLTGKFLEIIDVRFPEPIPGQQRENDLDSLLRKRRNDKLKNLREEALVLRESGVDISEGLQQIKEMTQELKNLAFEPQNSIPDVILWMISGNKRIAFTRIPAHNVLYSLHYNHRGKDCDQIRTLMLENPRRKDDDSSKLCAAVRVKLWFGLEVDEGKWQESQTDTDFTAFAETYENQVNILGNWTNKGPTMTRPSWSDASGAVKLKPDAFVLSSGWSFDGDWFIDPEPSLKYNEDAGRKAFLEDVFENQNRLPGSSWSPATTTWSDIRGDAATPRDEIEPPPNWEWVDVWQVDVHRAVDEEGWEYTLEATLGGYQPIEKTYHLCRRRRWVRLRKFIADADLPDQEMKADECEGWEYSTFFNLRFHSKQRRMDLVRRRRWHRKLIAEDPASPLVFKMASSSKKDTEDSKMPVLSCPRLSLRYKESHLMQLRVYLYQARDLKAGDKSGFSDPYVCLSFMNQSQKTEVISSNLNPTWDQTLIFENITVYGNADDIVQQAPSSILEVYDRDSHGDDEFLGRLALYPVIQRDCKSFTSPPLVWNRLRLGNKDAGEILSSCELFFATDSPPLDPPKRGNVFIVPSTIRPVLQLTAIEILCWGVRNMKTFELSPVNSPSIEFECGDRVVQSRRIKNAKNCPNFDDPVLYMEMMLPQEAKFMPAMNIRVRDHRQFGRKPLIGTNTISKLHSYMCQAVLPEIQTDEQLDKCGNDLCDTADTVIDIGNETEKDTAEVVDPVVDWWAKYYASLGDSSKSGRYLELGYDLLQVYPTELEKVEPYNGFSDFLNTFPLTRGISKELEESVSIGEFKGTFRVYPVPSDPNEPRPQRLLKTLPRAAKEEVLVRVYVVSCSDLAPKDSNGKADPFIRVKIGKKEVDNRKSYKPNTLSPIFGEVFELSGFLPQDKDLTISVWDYDLLSSDDLIGQTVIDLENRYLTKYRATCAVPASYQVSGLNQWRDSKKPSEILEDVCLLHSLPSPKFHSSTSVTIGKKRYALEDFENEAKDSAKLGEPKERLALHVLRRLDLVPEHVETRSIFNPASPDLEQGKVRMWVEMFPKSQGPPGPVVDISPRTPVKFELRLIIWNAYDVPLDETNAVSGDTMSDIYVKCSLADGSSQKTDVHYRSMDGEGNFNWRMIFPMEYLVAENRMVIKKKKHLWSLDETERLLPPKLALQIWDNDMFSSDDFLGSMEFSLTAMPLPAKSSQKCGLHQLGIEEGATDASLKFTPEITTGKHLNLFEKKRTHGFWPCYTYKRDAGYSVAGKLEMEFEILPVEEAKNKPAGIGRDEPNMNPKLEEPNRPATSFLWLTSPWKSFKFILWKNYKWYCITLLLIILAVLLVILFIYSFPEAVVYRLVN